MNRAWVDANLILRHLTQDPPDQARRVGVLFREAQAGRLKLLVDPITIAECVWVLASFYGHPRATIARALADFVVAEGIQVDEEDMLLAALQQYATQGVDFADALLAARAARHSVTAIYSFDRDFDRLSGITRIEPGD